MPPAILACTAMTAVLTAQSPYSLRMNAALPAPTTRAISINLTGNSQTPYAVLADVDAGPTDLLGERLYLGFSVALLTVDLGVTSAQGTASANPIIRSNPSMVGLSVYAQAVFLDPLANNGVFGASDHQTLVIYAAAPFTHTEFFERPAQTMTGSFDRTVTGRLQGGPVTTRVHSTVDPQGALFAQGVMGPINNYGAKMQMVYRPGDLGAQGDPELITAIRWRPFHGQWVMNGFVDRLELFAMHSHVTPDYTIDPFTAFPKFPQSGLARLFVANRKAGEIPQKLFDQGYAIVPSHLRPDGYMPYPGLAQPFRYNGTDSLVLEFRTYPSTNPSPQPNGQDIRLMVQSSPLPAARSITSGKPGQLVNPHTALTGRGDNAMADYQVEFTRVETVAVSPWLRAIGVQPDYDTPVLSEWLPVGTQLVVEYRGALDQLGSGATSWHTNIDIADGFWMLQYRVRFTGDVTSRDVPALDAIVIPYR